MNWTEDEEEFLKECLEDDGLSIAEIAEFFDGKTKFDIIEKRSKLRREKNDS